MNKVSSKEKLFTACKKILLEEGQSALTVRRVAKVAGVNQGLVHHYFGSKENMVYQLLDYESTQFADNAKKFITQSDGKKLPIKFLTKTDLGKLLIEIILLAQHMPGLKEKVRDIIIDRRNFFGSIFGIENENDRIFLQICVFGSVMLSFVDSTIKAPEVLQNVQDKIFDLVNKQSV